MTPPRDVAQHTTAADCRPMAPTQPARHEMAGTLRTGTDATSKPLWVRMVAFVTTAAFVLQGCGSGIGPIDEAAERQDTVSAPSAAVSTNPNSLLAGLNAELVGEPEFRLVDAADAEPLDGDEQLEDVAQSANGLAVKSASLARNSSGSPALYRCTVTQNFHVWAWYEPHHDTVRNIMRAKNNVVSGPQMRQAIERGYKDGLTRHIGGSAGSYLYSGNVNSKTIYTGYQNMNGSREPSRSLFRSELSFNTSDARLCLSHTSSPVTTVNGPLNPFWASMLAALVGSVSFAAFTVGMLSVAPELTGGGATPGAWDIGVCAAAMLSVVTYELAVQGGTFSSWKTWVGIFGACVAAVLPTYWVRGKWAATYAPWVYKVAGWVRALGTPRETIARGLEALGDYLFDFDLTLPIPEGATM